MSKVTPHTTSPRCKEFCNCCMQHRWFLGRWAWSLSLNPCRVMVDSEISWLQKNLVYLSLILHPSESLFGNTWSVLCEYWVNIPGQQQVVLTRIPHITPKLPKPRDLHLCSWPAGGVHTLFPVGFPQSPQAPRTFSPPVIENHV